MKHTKRLGALVLSVLLVLALAACSGTASADPNLGVYKLNGLMGFSLAEYAEMTGVTEEEAAESTTLELKADGKAVMVADEESQELDWTLEGENISITDGTSTMEGTLKDGVLNLTVEGVSIVFAK